MRVAEVMSRGVEPVDPAMSVQEAATQMAEFDIGAVLVGTGEALDRRAHRPRHHPARRRRGQKSRRRKGGAR